VQNEKAATSAKARMGMVAAVTKARVDFAATAAPDVARAIALISEWRRPFPRLGDGERFELENARAPRPSAVLLAGGRMGVVPTVAARRFMKDSAVGAPREGLMCPEFGIVELLAGPGWRFLSRHPRMLADAAVRLMDAGFAFHVTTDGLRIERGNGAPLFPANSEAAQGRMLDESCGRVGSAGGSATAQFVASGSSAGRRVPLPVPLVTATQALAAAGYCVRAWQYDAFPGWATGAIVQPAPGQARPAGVEGVDVVAEEADLGTRVYLPDKPIDMEYRNGLAERFHREPIAERFRWTKRGQQQAPVPATGHAHAPPAKAMRPAQQRGGAGPGVAGPGQVGGGRGGQARGGRGGGMGHGEWSTRGAVGAPRSPPRPDSPHHRGKRRSENPGRMTTSGRWRWRRGRQRRP
jgi:hypothetical protein